MNAPQGPQIATLTLRVTSIRSRGKPGGAIFGGVTDTGDGYVVNCSYHLLPDASIVDKGQVWLIEGPVTVRSANVKGGGFLRHEQVI
ncbi:MAG: hypothetical protein Q7U75_11725, partial [Desulfobacterales bacterium]|nr:hypothetical protein [Desulfobacterales bacterium]